MLLSYVAVIFSKVFFSSLHSIIIFNFSFLVYHLEIFVDRFLSDDTSFTFHFLFLYHFCSVTILCIIFVFDMILYLCSTVNNHTIQYNN